MMNNEYSAGGIVFKKIKHIWHVLLIQDKQGQWTFPKGLIDKGEEKEEAARREIREETGISFLSQGVPLRDITYWYTRDGQKIHKTVSYFLFIATGDEQATPQEEEGISRVEWIPISDALTMLGYKETNEQVFKEALRHL